MFHIFATPSARDILPIWMATSAGTAGGGSDSCLTVFPEGGYALFRWLLLFLRRFVLFCVVVIGAARAFSWLFAYDDEVKLWVSQNRSVIVLVLVLSAIMYAMYDWLEEDRG
jgi:hypothetical protein